MTGTADTLFSYFGNGFVTGFESLCFFIARFGELYHDEFTVAVVFRVLLHDGVGGCGGAGEKIDDN